MPRALVVSQPMFIPWIGLFEQARLADVFIHYDDVQLPNGRSFMSRVQIKTSTGQRWLSAPIDRRASCSRIDQTVFATDTNWRAKHLTTIRHAYSRAPNFDLMFELIAPIYENTTSSLAQFNIDTFETICAWLGIAPNFRRSSEIDSPGSSSERLVGLCKLVNADTYITGLGALDYLDHENFEAAGIPVRYMSYRKLPYPQLHGEFTPYVSILDAIANCGRQTRDLLLSDAVDRRNLDVEQDR